MDALLLIDTDDASYPNDDAMETLGDIVTRTRAVGGVLIFASTKESLAETPDEELSVFVPDEEDLVLRSEGPDVFDSISDLAPGLHDMAVDRIVIAGADAAPGAVYGSAMAALVCNFDVIVLSDSTTDLKGEPVDWMDSAEEAGAMVKKTADTWLRM
ncbi:isochorismatase family protein [Brevibacterium renqingii]|uniref:isochorismatase family protein n=1 Tax=Brevibacterium renqingii TaxID=2776916 RepID=UPI001ADF756A|nr:isochorismatase family protein [Brevibacterium renqingii]